MGLYVIEMEPEVMDEEADRDIALGRAVRECRLAHGLTQTQLAERAGMTQPEISRLEAGGGVPTIGTLDRIAAAIGVKLVIRFADQDAA